VKNARVVLVLVLGGVAACYELACEGAGDAPCLPGAKFSVLSLGKVSGMDGNDVEEAGFLLCVAEVLNRFDMFF
jgi:hypothetical protein